MRKINRKFGIVQLSVLLVVAFFAATPTANAGEALCELDWNEDGIVDWGDYYKEHMDGTMSGFYVDVYRHIHFASGIYGSRYNRELDWNGDGVVTMEDAGWRDEEGATAVEGSFHEQLYLFINWVLELGYTHYYEDWYPESDCANIGDASNTTASDYHECRQACYNTYVINQRPFGRVYFGSSWHSQNIQDCYNGC